MISVYVVKITATIQPPPPKKRDIRVFTYIINVQILRNIPFIYVSQFIFNKGKTVFLQLPLYFVTDESYSYCVIKW